MGNRPRRSGAAADPRAVAAGVLVRVDGGAYLAPALDAALRRSAMDGRDRAFATTLVYGTLRRRRSCDWLVDTHLQRPVGPAVRAGLRLGAFQLAFLGTPPHAAVASTVALVTPRARGLVNAVLRRVAGALPPAWPDLATELGYPDWIVEHLVAELGHDDALGALEAMNADRATPARPDGYLQDPASTWVAGLVPADGPGVVVDLCAGPGGKATAIAGRGAALVVGVELHRHRALAIQRAARAPGRGRVGVVVADGRCPPLRAGTASAVLVDAPCSGLGALRRRPDARWRIDPAAPSRLAGLQGELLEAGLGLLRPGGTLVYSACTLTREETVGIDERLAAGRPDLLALPPPGPPWRPHGRGALLLPQAAGTDGMYLLAVSLPPG
ncbi:MAG: transcription antitermination factor NusB [Acidimicrobiales bacterium]